MENIKVNATFLKDSKRYHRFDIDENQGITGVVYIPRSMKEIPEEVTISLNVKRQDAE